MTVLVTFEPLVERYFLNDSYGYRHGKSALDAIAVTRKRCWQYDWCLEFDIKGLFDNIPTIYYSGQWINIVRING